MHLYFLHIISYYKSRVSRAMIFIQISIKMFYTPACCYCLHFSHWHLFRPHIWTGHWPFYKKLLPYWLKLCFLIKHHLFIDLTCIPHLIFIRHTCAIASSGYQMYVTCLCTHFFPPDHRNTPSRDSFFSIFSSLLLELRFLFSKGSGFGISGAEI